MAIRPATMQPSSGRKTMAWYIGVGLALHQIDVFDRDRAAVAIEHDQDGEPDGGLGRRNGQHQQREDLPDQVAEERGERHQVDVDGEQDQLDRHQDDDDVLAVDEDAEDPEREQDRGDREVVAEPDAHVSPCPGRTFTTSIASALVRRTCATMSWRLTRALCCSVSTIAPTTATSSTTPAAWERSEEHT